MRQQDRGTDTNKNEEMEYIASFSGGKDSMATVILAHEHGEPLNTIIFSEVMFDENISGELPEHIQFIKEKCIPLFTSWGYKTKILHANITYMDCFNHILTHSKVPDRNGKKQGFPMAGRCAIKELKKHRENGGSIYYQKCKMRFQRAERVDTL